GGAAAGPRPGLGGVGVVTRGLSLLVYPLVQGRDAGWPAWAWLCLLASMPALAAFVAYERRQAARAGSPLVVLRLFRQQAFGAGLLVALAANAATASYLFALALYLQLGLRYSPLAAGLTLAPAAVGFFVAASVAVTL